MSAEVGGRGENNARSYDYLIAVFDEEKIKNRLCYIEKCAKKYIENKQIQDYVRINSLLIQEIILDYFADIHRLKAFHGIEKIKPAKIASYTAFWICRRKPLYLTDTVDDNVMSKHPYLIDINEWFACYMMISIVFDLNERWLLNTDEMSRWGDFSISLQYFLVYRIFTPQSLELIMEACLAPCAYPARVDSGGP